MKINTNSTPDKTYGNLIATFFTLLCVVFGTQAVASHGGDHGEQKPFNAGEMIVDHIKDAHSIHFFGHVSMPLPVILYTDKGLDVFMSSKLWDEHHNPIPYTSSKTGLTYFNNAEKIEIIEPAAVVDKMEHVHEVDSLATDAHSEHTLAEVAHAESHHAVGDYVVAHGTLIDFSITKSVLGMLMMLALVLFIFIRMARSYEKRKGQAPKGMTNLLEPFVLFIKDEVAMPALGKKNTPKYLPFLLTVFFFIWVCNLLGLVPFTGGFNITGTLSITAVLAVIVFLITSFSGNKHYWGHIFWPPGVPFFVKLLLVPIEIASVFIKPTVLMIRLTANINAGHIVILAFTSLILIFGEKSQVAGFGVGIFATLFMVFMFFIELLVAFLQAYVFTLLTALYFGDATQEHHHSDDHH